MTSKRSPSAFGVNSRPPRSCCPPRQAERPPAVVAPGADRRRRRRAAHTRKGLLLVDGVAPGVDLPALVLVVAQTEHGGALFAQQRLAKREQAGFLGFPVTLAGCCDGRAGRHPLRAFHGPITQVAQRLAGLVVDRKSVVEGTSGSVSVDLGGGREVKK